MSFCSVVCQSCATLITALENHSEKELSVAYIKIKLIKEYKRREQNRNISVMHVHAFKGKERTRKINKFCTYCHRKNPIKMSVFSWINPGVVLIWIMIIKVNEFFRKILGSLYYIPQSIRSTMLNNENLLNVKHSKQNQYNVVNKWS